MKQEDLPRFRYHPNPLTTGAVRPSDVQCKICGQIRGYIYAGPTYAIENLTGSICPWCIASGAAADRGVLFSDPSWLISEGLDRTIVAEVSKKTPGFETWQQAEWAVHCNDACEFHGDASREDLKNLNDEELARLWMTYGLDEGQWRMIFKYYVMGGDPAIYRFRCRHCRQVVLKMDRS